MQHSELLKDAFTRIRELVHSSADRLESAALAYRPEPGANSIAWLTWHLTRIQDDHVSEIAGLDQAWVTDGDCMRANFTIPRGRDSCRRPDQGQRDQTDPRDDAQQDAGTESMTR